MAPAQGLMHKNGEEGVGGGTVWRGPSQASPATFLLRCVILLTRHIHYKPCIGFHDQVSRQNRAVGAGPPLVLEACCCVPALQPRPSAVFAIIPSALLKEKCDPESSAFLKRLVTPVSPPPTLLYLWVLPPLWALPGSWDGVLMPYSSCAFLGHPLCLTSRRERALPQWPRTSGPLEEQSEGLETQ